MAKDDMTDVALAGIVTALQTLADNQRLIAHALTHVADAHVAQTESHGALAAVVNTQQKEGDRLADNVGELVAGIRGTQAFMLQKQRESEERIKQTRRELAERVGKTPA